MRKLNTQLLVETIACILFATILLAIVINNQYLTFVTPRTKPYLYFAAAVFLIWGIYGFTKLFSFQHKIKLSHCLVLIIPFLLLLLPKGGIDLNSITSGFVNGGTLNNGIQKQPTPNSNPAQSPNGGVSSQDASSQSSISSNTSQDSSPDGYKTKDFFNQDVELHGYNQEAKTITISNDEFYAWMKEIASNIDKFVGYQITVTGFVYHDDQYMAKNEFMPARLIMSCCVADVVPGGLMCEYDQASQLKKDSWVTVTGKLIKGEYNGNPEAQIAVESVKPADKVEGYVYPY